MTLLASEVRFCAVPAYSMFIFHQFHGGYPGFAYSRAGCRYTLNMPAVRYANPGNLRVHSRRQQIGVKNNEGGKGGVTHFLDTFPVKM